VLVVVVVLAVVALPRLYLAVLVVVVVLAVVALPRLHLAVLVVVVVLAAVALPRLHLAVMVMVGGLALLDLVAVRLACLQLALLDLVAVVPSRWEPNPSPGQAAEKCCTCTAGSWWSRGSGLFNTQAAGTPAASPQAPPTAAAAASSSARTGVVLCIACAIIDHKVMLKTEHGTVKCHHSSDAKAAALSKVSKGQYVMPAKFSTLAWVTYMEKSGGTTFDWSTKATAALSTPSRPL
jgi:hypothetical protein